MKNDNAKLKNSKENGRFKKFGFLMTFFVFFTFLFGIHSASADISTGLISNWKLDETSGTTATDSVGTNNGTVTGAVWTTGKINNALSFNGTNNYINFNTDLGVTGEMTVSAWVNPAKIPDGIGRLIASTYDWDADATLARGWYFGTVYGVTDVMMFRIYGSSGNYGLAQSSGFFASNLNKWAHIVGIYKPSTYIKLFINGVLVSESTTNIPSAVSNKVGTNFRIGARADYAGHGLWNGLIDDVRVYNRALSATDVTELYNISSPTVVTNSATNITSTSATLNAVINPKSSSTVTYFQYGLTTAYGNTSPTQTMTGSTDQSIFANISGLTANTVYYYRALATNSLGTTNGQEQSFTTTITTDAIAPIGSFAINSNAVSTDSVNVSLNLSATDNIGVTGYFVSENSTTPAATQSGWVAVTSVASYSANPSFTLSSGDGTKIAYVWYKDAAGNVSTVYNDSITLAKNDSWKNFYGIAWRPETTVEGINYAKQMGYDYITLKTTIWNKNAYAANSNRAGLKFYFIDPERLQDQVPAITTANIDTAVTYTQTQIDYIERYFVWKSTDTFPNNIATGWFASATRSAIVWDLQQQVVIDYLVEQIISLAKSYENTSLPFTFGGYMVDVPRLSGDFNIYNASKANLNTGVSLSYWTGSDSSLVHGTITHEYATYPEGKAAFYKQLNTRMRQEWSDSKWILEPYRLYSSTALDEWIYQIKDRADKDELTADMLFQEGSSTDFVDDANVFNSGVNITKDRVGISQPNSVGEAENRLYAAKAGINGAWYSWFGRFGGTGDMPAFNTIAEVYPRLKLVRLIPNWDNLRNIPLSQRTWNNSTTDPIYSSKKNTTDPNPTSYFDSHIMYSRQWKNNKLFVVFNDNTIPVKLNPNETISSIQCTDGYFIETTNCTNDFTITDVSGVKQLTLKSTVAIPTDTTNGQVKGVGYIITVSASSAGKTHYIDPSGSDTNNGLSESAPWKTISKVNSSTFSAGDSILLKRGGEWREQLTIPSSGTASSYITFGAYGTGNKPIINAAKTVTGWTQYSGNIYVADISSLNLTEAKQVFVDGNYYDLAHYPNDGLLIIDAKSTTNDYLIDNDLTLTKEQVEGAGLAIRVVDWDIENKVVLSYDPATHRINWNNAIYTNYYIPRNGSGYYLYGKLWMLDGQKEWYYDSVSKKVYIWLENNENPSTHTVEVSGSNAGISASSKNFFAIKDIVVKNSGLDGLYFKNSSSVKAENVEVYNSAQDGINLDVANNFNLQNSIISDSVRNGIEMLNSDSVNILNNEITNSGTVGKKPKSTHGGIRLRSGGDDSIIKNNKITKSGYTGITFSYTKNNLIQNNIIDGSCLVLSDCGGIYTWGVDSSNSKIIDNIVMNSIANYEGAFYKDSGAHGIYLDDAVNYMTVTGNTVINVDRGIVIKGNNHTIKNNNIYKARMDALNIRELKGSLFTEAQSVPYNNILTNNNFITTSGNNSAVWHMGDYGHDLALSQYGTYDYNVYFHPYYEYFASQQIYDSVTSKWPWTYYLLPDWQSAKNQDLNSKDIGAFYEIKPYKITSTVSSNLVSNGNFDTNITGWTRWPSTVAIVWNSSAGLDGGVVKLTSSDTSLSSQAYLMSAGFPIQSGKTYEIKFSIISDKWRDIDAGIRRNSGSYDWLVKKKFKIGSTRREIAFVFTPTESITSASFITGSNAADSLYYIDNVSVKEVTATYNDPSDDMDIHYNTESSSKTISLAGKQYCDVNNNVVSGSIALEPYASKILLSCFNNSDGACNNRETSATALSDCYGIVRSSSSSSSLVSSSSSSLASSIGNTGGGGGGGGGTPPQSSSSSSGQNSSASRSSSTNSSQTSSLSSSSQPTGSTSSPQAPTKTITQSLFLGLRSNQVQILQEMLSSDKTIYPEKLITGYYGQLTVQAVKRFQTKHKLEATGSVNLQTKTKLNETYGSSSKTASTSSSSSKQSNYSSLTETQKQALIKQLQETIKKLLEQLVDMLKQKAGR